MAGIGKNVIENLTTAMYENSFTIYREYVQNAADSIDRAVDMSIMSADEAVIDILIENNRRRITINDNAAGVPKDDFYKKLSDIADSSKDPTKEKGFRGIGRLAGLAYCDKLIFRTSAYGESIESIMEWDGVKLREVLGDSSQHPSAQELVDSLITCSEKKCDADEHFFEVIMENIIPESNELLDETAIKKYLEAVAPVPYVNSFIYKSKIYDFIKNEGLRLDEYDIEINGNPVFKQYKTKVYEGTEEAKTAFDDVTDIEFRKFVSDDGRLLAWLWFAVTRYEKQIPIVNQMRGIRLRKENIQIGNEETLSYPKFYKEPRGNFYFFGELFAVDSELIPNARRDYFKTNRTQAEFEKKVTEVLYTELYNLYHYANKVKNSIKKVANYEKKQAEFAEKESTAGFIDAEEKEDLRKELEAERKKAEQAKREIELRRKDSEGSQVLDRVFKGIETEYKIKGTSEGSETPPPAANTKEEKKQQKFMTQSLSKYSKKDQMLIAKIYGIIKAVLPRDMAEMLVKKIQEELSK